MKFLWNFNVLCGNMRIKPWICGGETQSGKLIYDTRLVRSRASGEVRLTRSQKSIREGVTSSTMSWQRERSRAFSQELQSSSS